MQFSLLMKDHLHYNNYAQIQVMIVLLVGPAILVEAVKAQLFIQLLQLLFQLIRW